MEEIEKSLFEFYKKGEVYITQWWNNILNSIYSFDYVVLFKFLIIIVVGYILAKIFSKYIPMWIRIIGEKIKFPIDNELILALRSFIFKLILYSTLLVDIHLLSLPESIDFISKSIVKSILLLSFVGFLLKMVKMILHKMAYSPREQESENVKVVQPSTLPLFVNSALIILSMVGIYQVLSIWNVDMTALLAGAGIGAMAVGMAAKDTLSDIIAGILILTDSPYRVGDVVYVRNNLKGRVSDIGLRNTRIVTKSNIEVIVPNTIMGTSQIINESSSKKDGIRIEVFISTSNKEDIHTIKRLLVEATKASSKIAQDKEIKPVMTGFQMDMLQFKVQCWIDNPEDKGSAKGQLMENIYLHFKEENIDITMTRYQHVKLSYEEAQELHITQFPKTEQEHFIKEFPDTKQEHFIKEFPDTKQEHFVKEFPDTKQEHFVKEVPNTQQDINIKEIPNIFDNDSPIKFTKLDSIEKDKLLKKFKLKRTTKGNNEK